jgi:selenocysteine lyase/cysteine desulfurase
MESKRSLFSIPSDVCYLNAAYMTPHSKKVTAACLDSVERRATPWQMTANDFFDDVETLRSLFASLLGSAPDNIALVPAVSYGIACAAKNLKVRKNHKILMLAEQFPSHYYSWARLAKENEAQLCIVDTPTDLDWTSAVLDSIASNKDSIAIAALPNHHWSNGAPLDLAVISDALRDIGASIVLDVTQTMGACPIDLEAIQPDFLVTAAYKWLFCPYGVGFLYVADKHFDGVPLEEGWANRRGSDNFAQLVNYEDSYQDGARRFDVGERSNFETVPGAVTALRQVTEWGIDNIARELDSKNAALAEIFSRYGFVAPPPERRGPHFQGLRFPEELQSSLVDTFASKNIFASQRGQSLRISPHVYNDDEDLAILEAALR